MIDPSRPISFVADEDFNIRIIRGLMRHKSDLDVVLLQDTNLSEKDDQSVLEWASQEHRILLAHDISTLTHYAFERTENEQSFAGLIEVPQTQAVSAVIEDILLIAECCSAEEFENQVLYLPL